MMQPVYQFEWDAAKARRNQTKHGFSFKLAMSVLRDPLALTVYDEDHSDEEDRWVTLGQAANGQYLIVIHTFQQVSPFAVRIRIISARKAEPDEINDYMNMPH